MKAGRPAIPSEARRSRVLNVRMTPIEFQRAEAIARGRGVSLAAVVRAGLRRWSDHHASLAAPARSARIERI
jgi:predicted HicB family RNase H-like nuclease